MSATGYYVGHGRHWHFLHQAGWSDDSIKSLIMDASVATSAQVAFERGDVQLTCEPDVPLGVGVLRMGGELVSAFPYARGGHAWPLLLRRRHQWPTLVEAQLEGTCRAAAVVWFDNHYARHPELRELADVNAPAPAARTLPPGAEFEMSLLAYSVERFAPQDQPDKGQPAMDWSRLKAYLPLKTEEASRDEIQFISHVEAVTPFSFHGVAFKIFTVTLAIPNDFDMRIDVFVPALACRDDLAVGDPIAGAGWLFGHKVG